MSSTLIPQRSRARAARVAAAIVVIGVMASVASGAGTASASAADGADPGLWYYNDYKVQDAHDAGFTGQGVKVAILDSPIDTSMPSLASADITVHEPGYCDVSGDQPGVRQPAASDHPESEHGTSMALLMVGNGQGPDGGPATLGVAPGAQLLFYATSYTDPNATDDGLGTAEHLQCYRNGALEEGAGVPEAIDQAIADGANIISMSFTANQTDALVSAVARAIKANVILVAGIANGEAMSHGMAAMNGIVTVQAMDAAGQIEKESAFADPNIDVVGPGTDILGLNKDLTGFVAGSGTSNATAITAGFLAVTKSKYPTATNNQLLQSLIHNTGPDDHDLTKDPENFWGYGAVSLQHMLRVDPNQYPDTNPFVATEGGFRPTYQEIYGTTPAHTAAADPSESASPGAAGQAAPSSGLPSSWLVYAGIALLALLVAAAVVVVLLVARSRRRRQPQPSQSGSASEPPSPMI